MAFEHPIEWTDENVSRLWDYYSRTPPYSELYVSKLYGDRILKDSQLPLGEALDVIDFGCGPGFIWDHLRSANSNWNYTGMDFSPESVDKVKAKAEGHPRFKGARRVEGLPTALPAAAHDVVLLLEVVEHLKDDYLHDTLQEVRRLLRPGGMLLITTPNEEDLSKSTRFCPDCGALFHEWQHVRAWSVQSLSRHLAQYGLELRHSKTLDLTANNLLRRAARLARKIVHGNPGRPHMIAVFQKR